MNISKLSVSVEIDGKPYFVLVPAESKQVLISLIAGISKNGELQVVSMPDGFSFQSLSDIKNGN